MTPSLGFVFVADVVSKLLYQLLDGVAIRNRSMSPRVKVAYDEYSLSCYHRVV
jgi:hypothetical protein